MGGTPTFTGHLGVVLGSPDPARLAGFYRDLLGWPITGGDGTTWITMTMRDRDGVPSSANLAFQLEESHTPPVWPAGGDEQQMQVHLDIGVTDVPAAVADALALGATQADFQPQDDVRVMLDPDGHPFCLWHDEN